MVLASNFRSKYVHIVSVGFHNLKETIDKPKLYLELKNAS